MVDSYIYGHGAVNLCHMLVLVALTFSVINRGFVQNQTPFNYHTTKHAHKGIITCAILLLFKKNEISVPRAVGLSNSIYISSMYSQVCIHNLYIIPVCV